MGAPLLALNPDTGLVHLGAREYAPETGAFTRRDPSGLEGGENQYAYAGGDPVNYWDPDGNFVAAVVVGAAAGAAIGGAEGAVFGAADEVLDQAFDPGRTGFDCGAIRSAAGRGAAAGAAAGAVAGGARVAWNGVPRPGRGRGSVPEAGRDGNRFFSPGDRARQLDAQGGVCANCSKPIDISDSRGHHVVRHSDGGRTVPSNHAEVCKECHVELHR